MELGHHRGIVANVQITFSLRYSLNVRDHASQPYSTIGNIIVLYILIIKFLERNQYF